MRWQQACPALLAVAVFSSCAGTKDATSDTTENPFSGSGGVPPHLLAGGDEGGTPIKPGGNVPAGAGLPAPDYKTGDLAWTDPDNPDAEIPDLQGLMASTPQKGPWRESEAEAFRESKKTGKPVLIWFTDSERSMACKSLSSGLLSTSEFEKWASANTVRLIVDQTVNAKEMDELARKQIYVRGLKKKYNARGYPSLLVVAPSGEVIGRYKSYRKGQEDFIWGQLKQGVSLALDNQKAWKTSLERKGYRDWSDGKGRVIFAKLAAYKDGELILVEPDGQRARTHEKNLSAGDRVWIQEQKALRGIQ